MSLQAKKDTDPKDTISLLQKHWNNAGQLTSQQSNIVMDAFQQI